MASGATLLASLKSQTVVDCDTLDVAGKISYIESDEVSRLTSSRSISCDFSGPIPGLHFESSTFMNANPEDYVKTDIPVHRRSPSTNSKTVSMMSSYEAPLILQKIWMGS